MRLSTRGRYGVKAMIELACNDSEQPLALRQIAERQGLSEHYLEQLIGPLRKAGLVRSVRGPQGGYLLAREPAEISIGDIIRTMEGPITPTDCALDDSEHIEHCGEPDGCIARSVWSKVRTSILDVVDSITLADLREQSEKRARERYMYYI